MSSSQLTFIFFSGVGQPPQRLCCWRCIINLLFWGDAYLIFLSQQLVEDDSRSVPVQMMVHEVKHKFCRVTLDQFPLVVGKPSPTDEFHDVSWQPGFTTCFSTSKNSLLLIPILTRIEDGDGTESMGMMGMGETASVPVGRVAPKADDMDTISSSETVARRVEMLGLKRRGSFWVDGRCTKSIYRPTGNLN